MPWREDLALGIARIQQLRLGDGLGTLVQPGAVDLNKIGPSSIYETFNSVPLCVAKDGAGAATGATGDENLMMFPGLVLEYHILGAGQTIVAPVLLTAGLNVGLDQADDEGVEICTGLLARNKGFTIGGPGFYAKMTFSIADVSGTDDCAFGFRKLEAYEANIDDYTDMAVLNVISGAINIETILNDAATDTTDTTDAWADAEEHTLEVVVNDRGVVTFLIDGVAPTVTAAFTFDDGDYVVPFFYLLNASDLAGEVNLTLLEMGFSDNDRQG